MITSYFFKQYSKRLSKGISKKSGRNFLGRVCVRGRGGGNKRVFRFIDMYRRINQFGKVLNVVYDPNRSARLAFVLYLNSSCSYVLLQKGVKINDVIYSGSKLYKDEKIRSGFSLPLKFMPLFSNISNIEIKPLIGSSVCRAAGTSCMLIGKAKNNKGILKLNSGWDLHVSLDCISSYGSIAYKSLNNLFIEKAGKNRAFG
jgi:large subunit ribosomal protein L2